MRWWMTWWEKAIATIYFAFERVMNATGKKKAEVPPSTDPWDNKHEGEGK